MKKSYNFDIKRPEPSADFIEKQKQFDEVLKQHTAAHSAGSFLKKTWFKVLVPLAAAGIGALVMVFSGSNKTPAVSKTETPQVIVKTESCVKPPLKGLDIPFDTFTLDATAGGTINYKTGSKISFPAACFTDAQGNAVSGKVSIAYREFHDPVDFLVSGIPMTYDSAGVNYVFESAGMLEMRASQNGQALAMANGKEARVEMRSYDADPKFSLYKLDDKTGQWSNMGKDTVQQEIQKAAPAVGAPDKKVILSAHNPEISSYNAPVEIANIDRAIAKAKDAAPVKPKLADPGNYTFNLNTSPEDYPELAGYKDVLFEVKDGQNFSADNYKVTWQTIKLSENPSGSNYIITLEKDQKRLQYEVYPVFEKGEKFNQAKKVFEEKFAESQSIIKQKEEEKKEAEKKYQAALQEARAKQAAYQAAMARVTAQQNNAGNVIRVFSASSFGIWNCDNPMLRNAMNTTATFEIDGELAGVSTVYQIDSRANALITNYCSDGATSNIKYRSKRNNIFFTFIDNNKLAMIDESSFAGLNESRGRVTIPLKTVGDTFASVEEVKDYVLRK